MAKIKGDKTFFHGKAESTGVLLINLGTPQEPTKSSVRRFLRQFLSDSRVVEIPRLIWLPILYAFILPRRPAETAKNYKKIWVDEGSPLMHYSVRQQALLQKEMESRFSGPVNIELAMRYGKPEIESGINKLQEKGARRVLIFPLYPQYSATTTATSFDEIFKIYSSRRWIPELRFIAQYHDHPAYINALAESIQEFWKNNQRSEMLVMSFHGLPKRNLDLGDPYFCQCQKTGRLLAQKLGLEEGQWKISYQSRFGKAEWLKPYTDKTLSELPTAGVKSVDVVCPGFSADCIETLEEINMENRGYFMEAGGKEYQYIPALNDNPEHIKALADIIQHHTQGWAETDSHWQVSSIEKSNKNAKQRAQNLGAKI